jgi:uncharacterized protein YjiS (DUF1127 family)
MTLAQLTTTHHDFTDGLARRLKRLYRTFETWQARRATREILRSLDGRTLKDIGLDANEIDSVVFSEHDERRNRYEPQWKNRWRG